MADYNPQQKIDDYSPSLLEKALGFVKVFGIESIPDGAREIIDYALKKGDISQKQIKSAQDRYEDQYARDALEGIFS
jgi:hypothetical protein